MSDASGMSVTAGPGEPADADGCFARLVTVLNSGMLALMIGVGERVGLFHHAVVARRHLRPGGDRGGT